MQHTGSRKSFHSPAHRHEVHALRSIPLRRDTIEPNPEKNHVCIETLRGRCVRVSAILVQHSLMNVGEDGLDELVRKQER